MPHGPLICFWFSQSHPGAKKSKKMTFLPQKWKCECIAGLWASTGILPVRIYSWYYKNTEKLTADTEASGTVAVRGTSSSWALARCETCSCNNRGCSKSNARIIVMFLRWSDWKEGGNIWSQIKPFQWLSRRWKKTTHSPERVSLGLALAEEDVAISGRSDL